MATSLEALLWWKERKPKPPPEPPPEPVREVWIAESSPSDPSVRGDWLRIQ